jgi:hypothetical protein
MWNEIAITGTRRANSYEGCKWIFEKSVRPFVVSATVLRPIPSDTYVARFWLGGALGIDTHMLHWLADHTVARINVVVPNTLADQPAEARERIELAIERGRVGKLIELKAGDSPQCFHIRNRYLVDHAQLVIGFPLMGRTVNDRKGGTWSTLTYAHEVGKPHLIAFY